MRLRKNKETGKELKLQQEILHLHRDNQDFLICTCSQSTLLVRVAVIELRFSGSKLAQVLGLPSLQGGSLHELWGQPGLTRQPGASKPPATLSMPHACALLSTYIQKAL